MVRKRAIVELGVEEAYAILRTHLSDASLPPIEAIENEDWGRNFVLSKIWDLDAGILDTLGLSKDDPEPNAASM